MIKIKQFCLISITFKNNFTLFITRIFKFWLVWNIFCMFCVTCTKLNLEGVLDFNIHWGGSGTFVIINSKIVFSLLLVSRTVSYAYTDNRKNTLVVRTIWNLNLNQYQCFEKQPWICQLFSSTIFCQQWLHFMICGKVLQLFLPEKVDWNQLPNTIYLFHSSVFYWWNRMKSFYQRIYLEKHMLL